MNKLSVIKALQEGLAQAVDVIEFYKKGRAKDENVEHVLENLYQLLRYSEHVHDEHPSKSHPLYNN